MTNERSKEELLRNAKSSVTELKKAAHLLLDYVGMVQANSPSMDTEDYDGILDMLLLTIEELDDIAMDFSVAVESLGRMESNDGVS
jgi:hypothetical protein|tara:strand:- start:1027 stop:1284 length:258 start_codon:yes stop_codon:yes gene_type:complete